MAATSIKIVKKRTKPFVRVLPTTTGSIRPLSQALRSADLILSAR